MRELPLAHNFASPIEQADLVLCRAPVDAGEPAKCLVSHGPVLSCPTSRHDACRNLYGRSRARLPTGHPSWPTCQGTGPTLVLVARVRNWSLPTGRLARSAYTGTDRALPDTGGERRARPADELFEVRVELGVEPALVDRAAPQPAAAVAERFSDVGQAKGDARLLKRRAGAPEIAERSERGCDGGRRLRGRGLAGGFGLAGLVG